MTNKMAAANLWMAKLPRDQFEHVLALTEETRNQFYIMYKQALAAETAVLRYVVEECGTQFSFYAEEHRKAGKEEKAATNQDYADMCAKALTQHGEVK